MKADILNCMILMVMVTMTDDEIWLGHRSMTHCPWMHFDKFYMKIICDCFFGGLNKTSAKFPKRIHKQLGHFESMANKCHHHHRWYHTIQSVWMKVDITLNVYFCMQRNFCYTENRVFRNESRFQRIPLDAGDQETSAIINIGWIRLQNHIKWN